MALSLRFFEYGGTRGGDCTLPSPPVVINNCNSVDGGFKFLIAFCYIFTDVK